MKKSDLLKKLGWNDDLIRHFLVEDSDYYENEEKEPVAEVYDSHSMTVSFSAGISGSSFVVKRQL